MGPIYSLDANVLIFLGRNMPMDVYPGVWEQLEQLVADGRAVMPRDVFEELTRADDDCLAWAKAQAGLVDEPDTPHVLLVQEITGAHIGWVRGRENAGDPWLVAHAQIGGYVIVTNEHRRGANVSNRKLTIPNVADNYGVECLSFNDLAREEGWVFVRTS